MIMWKWILLGLVVLVAVLAVFVAMQPAEFQVSRSASFAAPPEAVFVQVNELERWSAWQAYERA
jgi:hypothetical protein